MRSNQGDQLQLDMYMSRSQGRVKGGYGPPVCELWLPGVCLERLRSAPISWRAPDFGQK